MSRKQLVALVACTLAGLFILVFLYASSPIAKEISPGGFNRVFVSPALTEKGGMDLKFNSFYFAGNTKEKLYLGNLTAPLHLLVTNLTLTDSQHVNLKIDLDSIKSPRSFKLLVDSPYFFLSHGGIPEMRRGQIDSWEAFSVPSSTTDYFADAVPLGKNSFAMRSYSPINEGFELAKKSSKEAFRYNNDLLEKQIDGLFCVEGQLHFNKALNQIVYLYNYRNEFIVADTNLVLNYRGHTIDTLSKVKIRVAQVETNRKMLASPPMRVNGKSVVYQNNLYVQSSILADNEDREKFSTASVIDTYDLATGHYKYSFYIPNHYNEKASDFRFIDKHLAVIYGQYLVIYRLDDTSLASM